MILLVTLLLLAAVLVFVGAPLFMPSVPPREVALPPADEQRHRLVSERENALSALQDLEFEHTMGNLDEADYAAMRQAQRHKAVAILRELDTLGATTPDAPDTSLADALTLDARLEEEIARARQRLAATEATVETTAVGGGLRCPVCGALHTAAARFCSACGLPFEHEGRCSSCGAPRPTGARFCAGCGATFEWAEGEL